MNAAILTLSDKGSRGERVDTSGPALSAWLAEKGVPTLRSDIIPDDRETIVATLAAWVDSNAYDLILTTGGTGVSPRDVTPDATLQILDRVIPATAREIMACGVFSRLRARITSPKPGITRSRICSVASGVTSRGETPVPPVVRIRS
jgi:molybdenum cofactor synthesis domain-containing protein